MMLWGTKNFDGTNGDAPFASDLIVWKTLKNGRKVVNIADSDNDPSCKLSELVVDQLMASKDSPGAGLGTGRPLEMAVASSLETDLPKLDPSRTWTVGRGSEKISDFLQYKHLEKVNQLVNRHAELRTTLGTDYLIKPDVTVGLPSRHEWEPRFLHAAVSCKWTIRSDRVQNIRHENNQMIRHRRERLPHLVTVTAEPLPTRLAAIARGTGEVDAVYHVAYGALDRAIGTAGFLSREQRDAWEEVTEQGRVRPYSDLAKTLAYW
ncbi:NgoMIV family type II restriction endonuclease [Arthrobacter caoxuetaonis]|uniref:Restriction endonuclease n=1 Tax=Arthrobacter caoxuetaonis TaxID=2886935 RepID=A0A9X1MDT5_9MICC|nr:NgoMIV family type II restriction endonuclease [Arthrobacter caoxuetaonis]MCC3297542.1 hypothetical protein [Arthrobacter caoxuetaonis]USQ57927.1 hypothetical protein NF551_03485 [Arthrobacter caoxuetaonis]